jgi:hypothetical protein
LDADLRFDEAISRQRKKLDQKGCSTCPDLVHGDCGCFQAAMAERITNPVAEFSGLDKITGRITTFDVYIK